MYQRTVSRGLSLLLPCVLLVAGCSQLPLDDSRSLLGTQVTITIHAIDKDRLSENQLPAVMQEAFEEVARIQNLAQWRQLRSLNSYAGVEPYEIGGELIALIDQSYLLADETGWAFRPDLGPLTSLWAIGTDEARLPADWEIQAALARIDSTRFTVHDTVTAMLEPFGASIDLGGVAKGYAVDRACVVLHDLGVTAAMVWAGGDLRVFGEKPNGEPWRVAVRHPRDPEQYTAVLELRGDRAVATSGDYERYLEVDGHRYHHILDPLTGYPSRASVSATVVAPTCMDADAYATALFVLGPEDAVFLADELSLPAMVIAAQEDELVTRQTSSFDRLRASDEAVLQP